MSPIVLITKGSNGLLAFPFLFSIKSRGSDCYSHRDAQQSCGALDRNICRDLWKFLIPYLAPQHSTLCFHKRTITTFFINAALSLAHAIFGTKLILCCYTHFGSTWTKSSFLAWQANPSMIHLITKSYFVTMSSVCVSGCDLCRIETNTNIHKKIHSKVDSVYYQWSA